MWNDDNKMQSNWFDTYKVVTICKVKVLVRGGVNVSTFSYYCLQKNISLHIIRICANFLTWSGCIWLVNVKIILCIFSPLSDSVTFDEGGESFSKTRFAQTERMSTYLLAFIVSDFTSIEAQTDNVLVIECFCSLIQFILHSTVVLMWISRNCVSLFAAQIRIFAREEAINAGHGDYALNITGKILKFFEGYYNIPYPLPKSGERWTQSRVPWRHEDTAVFLSV